MLFAGILFAGMLFAATLFAGMLFAGTLFAGMLFAETGSSVRSPIIFTFFGLGT